VIRTRVGYTGGSTPHPTYRNLADHTESIQIDYDPQVLSYTDLLKVFWRSHRPDRSGSSRQYMSAIFYSDGKQKDAALESKQQATARLGAPVATKIMPLQTFTRAEDYHQKYYLRGNREMMREFAAMYPDARDFTDSTAAARVNGYLGGHGEVQSLENDIGRLGLSRGSRDKLTAMFQLRAGEKP
jgi:peptide-methionine (S)-S-oxide reductase